MKTSEELRSEVFELIDKNLVPVRADPIKRFLTRNNFFDVPASTKYHGNYPGGLAEHSLCVAKNLMDLTEKLKLGWDCLESPVVIGLLHDVCKCDQYKDNPKYMIELGAPRYLYRTDSIYSHHGEKSICMLASSGLVLTQEEVACIRWHMGAYETDTNEWKYYGNAIEKFPNVLWTHTADMMASHIQGV